MRKEEELAKHFVRQRLTSKENLQNWLKGYLQVDLADCTVSRYATANPLEMVWQIYQLCANDSNAHPVDLRYIAGRASQKTLALAALQILLPLHFKRSVVHFGGTVAQANRAYDYFRTFVTKPYIRDYLSGEPTQKKTDLLIDGTTVTVEILPITQASVQGAHAPIVSLDELASLASNKVKAYSDVRGVPVYTTDGKPWIKFGISSRKGAHTVIEEEYSESAKSGMKFYFWTVLENTQRCPDEISGTEPLSYYVDINTNTAYLESDFLQLPEQEKSKFEKVDAYNKCFECPLRVVCAGDLKRQNSSCKTLRPVQSVITEFKLADYDWFISQLMSLQPSLEGIIFPKFKKTAFLKTANEIYEIFTGTKFNGVLSTSDLIDYMLSQGVRSYAGLDHGYTDPLAIVVIFEDSVGNIYVMKTHYESGVDPDKLVEIVRLLHQKYKFDTIYPDTSQPALNNMLKKAKICKIHDNFDKKGQIENGITLIRQKISPTVGSTKFFGLQDECAALVDELEKYHYATNAAGEIIEEPVDKDNHCIDALRYAAVNRWSKSKSILFDAGQSTQNFTKVDQNVQFDYAAPSQFVQQKLQELGISKTQSIEKPKKKGAIWKI